MKFFGVHIEDLESERFLSATNDQIATWLFLHALCSKQCNCGVLDNAATLPERYWGRHGIEKCILEKPSPLWSWNGEHLAIEPYDIDGQNVYERKVAGGKSWAKKRWGNTADRTPSGSPDGSPHRTPSGSPHRNPNAPNPTQPNPTQPEKTSSSDEGGSLSRTEQINGQPKERSVEVFDYWNGVKELPGIKAYSPDRKRHLEARMKESFFRNNWKKAIDQIPKLPFLMGMNERGWRADIDWFLKPGSVGKIIEGKYANSTSKSGTPLIDMGNRKAPTKKI